MRLAVSSFKGTRRQKQPGGGLIAALALNEVGVCGSCSVSLSLVYFLYSFDHSLTELPPVCLLFCQRPSLQYALLRARGCVLLHHSLALARPPGTLTVSCSEHPLTAPPPCLAPRLATLAGFLPSSQPPLHLCVTTHHAGDLTWSPMLGGYQ